MKKILYLCLLVFMSQPFFGQESPRLTQRVYLWDVTLSMKGYEGKTPNIYDDVVRYLEKCIDEVKDESTEIYVLPFQESVLETWSARATVEGKQYLVEKIKSYQNECVTNTNIVKPIQYVKQNILSNNKDKYTFFALLTDGKQSEKFGGMNALAYELRNWHEEHTYFLYIMLTPEAVDQSIISAADMNQEVEVVNPDDSQLELVDIASKEQVKINLKDDQTISVTFSCNSNSGIPDGVKVSYTSNDEMGVVEWKGETMIEQGKITVNANYNKTYDELKTLLPETYNATLEFSIVNETEVKNNTQKIVKLTNNITKVILINKPEKTLKISLKK